MKYLLITANIDWADEFGCEMFGVFTDEQWTKICHETKEYFKRWNDDDLTEEEEDNSYSESGEVEAGFGTNESLTFSDYKDWIRHFEQKEITKDQYNFLLKSFGKTYGTGDGAFFVGVEKDEDGDIIEMTE